MTKNIDDGENAMLFVIIIFRLRLLRSHFFEEKNVEK